MKSAKKPDCENTDTFFKTIELVNDSLVSEASPTEKSGIGDTKQTKVKSPLVQYPIDSIPSYEGSIGSSTTVSLTRACVSCIPDATVFLSDEDGKGVLSTEKQRMSTTKQKETHIPKLQGISTLSHTTSSSPPLDVLLPFPSHVAGRRVVARLRPLSHLPVDSLPPTQSRPPSSRRAAQPRDQNPPEIGSRVPSLPRSTVRNSWTGSPRYPTNSTSARRPPFSRYVFPPFSTQFLLVDKFLETRELPRDRLQCLGAAALLLAAKFCDDTHPSLESAVLAGVSSSAVVAVVALLLGAAACRHGNGAVPGVSLQRAFRHRVRLPSRQTRRYFRHAARAVPCACRGSPRVATSSFWRVSSWREVWRPRRRLAWRRWRWRRRATRRERKWRCGVSSNWRAAV